MKWPFSGEGTSVSCYQLELLSGGWVLELASKEDLGEAPVVFSTVCSLFILLKFTPSRYSFSRILVGHNF